MSEKKYLNLLLLCGILCQGIIGNLANENIKEPSDILIRQKRVINRIPGEDQTVSITSAPYVVMIKEQMRIKCVGSILSHHVVITIPACIETTEPAVYQVVSSSAYSNYGSSHNVINIKSHFGHHPQRRNDGATLLTILPPFEYGRYTNSIQLHSGPLLPGALGTVYGWGFNFRESDRGTAHPRALRAIEVPIMAHQECVNIYRSRNVEISEQDICTFHPLRHCGHTDGGAPLVIDGYLVGIHLWTGIDEDAFCRRAPAVFVVLQHLEYNSWITSNIRNIEAHF